RLKVCEELFVKRCVRRRREWARAQLLDERPRPCLRVRTEPRFVVGEGDGGANLFGNSGAGPVGEKRVQDARRQAKAAAQFLLWHPRPQPRVSFGSRMTKRSPLSAATGLERRIWAQAVSPGGTKSRSRRSSLPSTSAGPVWNVTDRLWRTARPV